jgi:hypothetical protein
MTSDPREFTVLARNLYALLAHGTFVWYCDHCDFTSEGTLVDAGKHMRQQHPIQLRDADDHFMANHL